MTMLLMRIIRPRAVAAVEPPVEPAVPVAPEPVADPKYTAAFSRVRLVRAWIGTAAAMVALGYAFAGLLDRVLP